MRKSTLLFAAALITLFVLLLDSCGGGHRYGEVSEEKTDSIPPLGFWTEDFAHDEGIVKSGETFSGLMNRLGMSQADAYLLAQACDSVFDVRKLRAGNTYQTYSDSLSDELKYVVYNIDRTSQAIFGCSDSLFVNIYTKKVLFFNN